MDTAVRESRAGFEQKRLWNYQNVLKILGAEMQLTSLRLALSWNLVSDGPSSFCLEHTSRHIFRTTQWLSILCPVRGEERAK